MTTGMVRPLEDTEAMYARIKGAKCKRHPAFPLVITPWSATYCGLCMQDRTDEQLDWPEEDSGKS